MSIAVENVIGILVTKKLCLPRSAFVRGTELMVAGLKEIA